MWGPSSGSWGPQTSAGCCSRFLAVSAGASLAFALGMGEPGVTKHRLLGLPSGFGQCPWWHSGTAATRCGHPPTSSGFVASVLPCVWGLHSVSPTMTECSAPAESGKEQGTQSHTETQLTQNGTSLSPEGASFSGKQAWTK